ncbi:hypothetical protein CEB94_16400 [Streptomyces hawaiiensis]|uniref:Uncharacterized protein n=1 Tax=Streptomyces hawaiiensis TaxID=67305 RepID=A0A6G5REM5_9ACTN|nr:hypothetical protein CEB94_16400 [Streptomyces hawaiiensis]
MGAGWRRAERGVTEGARGGTGSGTLGLRARLEIICGPTRADSSACCDYGHWPVTYLTTAFATVMRMG